MSEGSLCSTVSLLIEVMWRRQELALCLALSSTFSQEYGKTAGTSMKGGRGRENPDYRAVVNLGYLLISPNHTTPHGAERNEGGSIRSHPNCGGSSQKSVLRREAENRAVITTFETWIS